MTETQTKIARYKELWCKSAKVLVLVAFCLAQIKVNAQLYVSENALVVNENPTENSKDSLITKNIDKIFVSSDALVIANNNIYQNYAGQAPPKITHTIKKEIASKKIAIKKITHYTAKKCNAYFTCNNSQNLSYTAALLLERSVIAAPQINLLKNIFTAFTHYTAHHYLLVFALLFLLLLLYYKNVLGTVFFNKPPPYRAYLL